MSESLARPAGGKASAAKAKRSLVVYTALFGGYDVLREPKRVDPECDYICFTDAPIKSSVWRAVQVHDASLSPTLLNRRYKLLPHRFLAGYASSLYVDANVRLVGYPSELAARALAHHDMACPRHFERDCLYAEAEVCAAEGRVSAGEAAALVDRFQREGFPRRFGLSENNIIFRNHLRPAVMALMEAWWMELKQGPKRDQLSLMYLCWKHRFELGFIQPSARNRNNYFRYGPHADELSQDWVVRFAQYVHARRGNGLPQLVASKGVTKLAALKRRLSARR